MFKLLLIEWSRIPNNLAFRILLYPTMTSTGSTPFGPGFPAYASYRLVELSLRKICAASFLSFSILGSQHLSDFQTFFIVYLQGDPKRMLHFLSKQ